jgi:hypothetical protein
MTAEHGELSVLKDTSILLGRSQPFADEFIGEYQCGFQKKKLIIDQLSVIGQVIEKV